MCVADYCEANPASIDGSLIDADPNAPDANVSNASCGALEILNDDFADGVVGGWPWDPWHDPGVSLAESGGDLVISVSANAGDNWGGYGSMALYDLTESQLQAEVDQVGGQDTLIEVRGYNNEKAQLVAEGNQLIAAVFNVAGAGQRAQVALDLPNQKYWRIREHAGRMYWEYSADRQSWTHLWDEPDPFPITDVYGYATAGTGLPSASAAHFGDVGGQGTTVGYCEAASLHDSFTSNVFDPVWGWWDDAGCSITETGGELVMTYDGAEVNCFTGISTHHRYDLNASAFVIDASTIPAVPHFITYVSAEDPSDPTQAAHLEIGLDWGDGAGPVQLYLEEQRANGSLVNSGDLLYDAGEMRYWRLRGAGGHYFIDTSPDNATWTTRLDAVAQIDLSAAQLDIGAGNYDLTTPTTVHFGAVNP